MPGVSFALADFVTGGPIVDLPIKEGASWAAQLNRPDSLSCEIDMNDPDAQYLDLRSAATGKKSVLVARANDTNAILAWGLVSGDRDWDEDTRTLSISATGIDGVWLGNSIVGPATALTLPLLVETPEGLVPNPSLDTSFDGYSLGTIGKKLIEQRLQWPGSPIVFSLPPDQAAERESPLYEFSDLSMIRKRLDDLTNRENGPDFAFDAGYGPDEMFLIYTLRHGTEQEPRIGSHVGTWNVGGSASPIFGLKYTDNVDDFGSAVWMSAGRSAGVPLMSRALNPELVTADGFPPYDVVDKSRSTVELQDTLDDYAEAAADYVKRPTRNVSFSVRGEASPGLGAFRPGDTVMLTVGDHPWITDDLLIRIMSMDGDESGTAIGITCEVVE